MSLFNVIEWWVGMALIITGAIAWLGARVPVREQAAAPVIPLDRYRSVSLHACPRRGGAHRGAGGRVVSPYDWSVDFLEDAADQSRGRDRDGAA